VPLGARSFSTSYWLYLSAGALIAAGFADFALIAFHFQKATTVAQSEVPVFYSVAMAMGAVASLVVGRLLDKLGLPALIAGILLSAFFAPLVFLGGERLALVGMMLLGIGMGVQDSSLKAVQVAVVPREKRSTSFGMFDT
jgi:predicted MFS family arabinose efflux permease